MFRGTTRVGQRGFTLIEVLLAVGIAAVVAIGIAAVFAAAGEVVTGGRSVSRFSRAAAQIEAQFRADISQMTRDGYLVIRNERAFDGDDVATHPDQRPDAQRPRRIDELLFFTRGNFNTARESLVSGHVATSDTARVYYGHGMPINPTISSPAYEVPELVDIYDNNGGAGIDAQSVFGDRSIPENPLAYASDWNLLRHVLLLTQPSNSFQELPANPPLDLDPIQFEDSDVQVALQPAASHMFRTLMRVIPDQTPDDFLVRPGLLPQLASGLVDVATTDLTEIRSIIVGMQRSTTNDPVFPEEITSEADFVTQPNRSWAPPPIDLGMQDGQEVLMGIHKWMRDGLPAASDKPSWDRRVRMRAEPFAPNFLGIIGEGGLGPAEQVYRASDQLMLSSSNFVPNCTEFIVEWSFGEIYPQGHPLQGRTVWHGLERHIDLNGDGNEFNDPPVAVPYDTRRTDFIDFRHTVPYRFDLEPDQFGAYPVGGVTGGGGIGGGAGAGNESWLIHGLAYEDELDNQNQLLSYFGYHDPTFNPSDPDRDGDPFDAAIRESLPWPWPELLRVTVSLADPNDPSLEETFQFVIELPGSPDP